MKQAKIQHLKLSHFKSIDTLELRHLNDFSVFAGANGSGKSNFFDALDFVSRFMRHGITDALRWHGGFDLIHSIQENEESARRFEFEIECILPTTLENHLIDTQYQYQLIINSLDTDPEINEQLFINQEKTLIRNESLGINLPKEFNPFRERLEYSGLSAIPRLPLSALLRNISIYRIDNPFRAHDQEQSNQDASVLKSNAYNLASVLRRLEQDDNLRETILEWMETVVPSIQDIKTERQNLAKEEGRQFPAHLMSDGTIYALSLLVAVLDTPKYGLTLIEEPERGLHPQAIFELIDLIREQASHSNSIWMTTHSESVVRQLKLNELWLVDKKKGRTQMKSAAAGSLQQADLAPLGVDEAWLSNS
ncbi:MAG: ABC transporter ATP-binding protein [Candidatus Parabeggiatoa sp. nov. 3]|nr:MAG: ABC transporter ATP-binding protein [Gammaproteobacteria bacterium]RKZ79162.1 MAG: ABC transporter ATP-binding protein [Gammaproteobacteria bacterium]HEW91741.1 ABC transporter ATP-binding protein [Thermotogaceae bacterium]